jgi:hypothetical protein
MRLTLPIAFISYCMFTPVLPAAEPLPSDALRVLDDLEQQEAAIRQEAEQKMAAHRQKAMAVLRELQDRYTREARLDEAVAIRDRIRTLNSDPYFVVPNILPGPDRLYEFRSQIGTTLLFQVTGRLEGSVWGTDIYTGDSALAAAAVHAGAVEVGETRVVKVTILPGQDSYAASTRHGLTTSSYSTYPFSFKVERTNHAARWPVMPPGAAPFGGGFRRHQFGNPQGFPDAIPGGF